MGDSAEEDKEEHHGEHDAIPAERGEAVPLDVAEERLHGEQRGDEADHEADSEHVEVADEIASRNENSTMVRLETPISEPPTIVAADRDTPGIIAIDWNRPIATARP